jgi:hypothetical protein
MGYEVMGRAHAAVLELRARLAGAAGQGTVEYVALMLLVAGLMAGVIAATKGLNGNGIGKTVADKLKEVVEGVGGK